MNKSLITLLKILSLACLLDPGTSLSKETTFVVGLSSSPSTADPHYRNAAPEFNLSYHLFQPVFRINHYSSNLDYILATDLTLLDPVTWEIELKKNILFHDGSMMTSADVIYSFNRIANHPDFEGKESPLAQYTRGIKSITPINNHRIQIVTTQPNYDITFGITRIFIVKKPEDGATSKRADFDAGGATIGTGPYQLVSFSPNDTLLKRFDTFHGEKPDIDNVQMLYVDNRKQRLNGFINGDIHLIEKFNPNNTEFLSNQNDYTISKTSSHRLMFLSLYAGSNSRHVFDKKTGEALTKNPLADVKVRQAISIAIDREFLVNDVLKVGTGVAHQYVSSKVNTYEPSIPEQPFDVARAKKLLTEAGYPNGFGLTLHGPNNRYLFDEKVLASIAKMLSAIGIDAKATSMPKKQFFAERGKHLYAASYAGYNTNGRAIPLLNALLHTHNKQKKIGERNYSDISNPQLDRLLEDAETTLEPAIQRRHIRQAAMLGMEQLTTIPLYFEPTLWLIKDGYEYWPSPNGRTVISQVKKLH